MQVDRRLEHLQSQLRLDGELRPLEADLAVDELVVHKLDADLQDLRRDLQLDSVRRLLFFIVLALAVLRLALLHPTVESIGQVLGDEAHVPVHIEHLVVRPVYN